MMVTFFCFFQLFSGETAPYYVPNYYAAGLVSKW